MEDKHIVNEKIYGDGTKIVSYDNCSYIIFNKDGLKTESFINGLNQTYYYLKDQNYIKEVYKFEHYGIQIFKLYDFEGFLAYEARCTNGKLDGNIRHYWGKKLIIESNYKDGISVGIENYFYPNGRLMREILYGEDGKWIYIKTFNDDGTLFSIQDKDEFRKM